MVTSFSVLTPLASNIGSCRTLRRAVLNLQLWLELTSLDHLKRKSSPSVILLLCKVYNISYIVPFFFRVLQLLACTARMNIRIYSPNVGDAVTQNTNGIQIRTPA